MEHRARSTTAGRALAAYVPRLCGMPVNDVFTSHISEDDARLAVARAHGAPSWEVLLEHIDAASRSQPGDWAADPMRPARSAMATGDVGALEGIVASHPELLHPSERDVATGRTLMSAALGEERASGADAMRPIMGWLAAHGFDRRRELGARLCGHGGMTPAEVRDHLESGADPDWVEPSGIPVLEVALLRYWNGDAVDVLAARATPRRALWIAAGLGDVNGVAGFLDRQDRPIPAARQLRPDFVAAGAPAFMTPLPDPDDEELLVEAMLVAMLNGRTDVLEYLAAHGAPLNSVVAGAPLITIAVGNGIESAVDCLVRCGSDLELHGERVHQSARALARDLFEGRPEDAVRRRIVELCGMDPAGVLAERDARPLAPPRLASTLERAIALARDDAARLGQADTRPENLLIGLLRGGGPPLHFLTQVGGLDGERFRADLVGRIDVAENGAAGSELAMDAEAQAALDAAVALAAGQRKESVYGLHLLHALTRAPHDAVAQLLTRFGANPVRVHADLAKSL